MNDITSTFLFFVHHLSIRPHPRAITPLSGGVRALRGKQAAATVGLVPSHAEVESNEVADRMAMEAAAGELYGDSESRRFQSRTSTAYLKRRTAESKTRGRKERIAERTKGRRSYIPPKKTRVSQGTKWREEGDRVKVLPAAGGTCLDRTLP